MHSQKPSLHILYMNAAPGVLVVDALHCSLAATTDGIKSQFFVSNYRHYSVGIIMSAMLPI
jgi:hypothetical protein